MGNTTSQPVAPPKSLLHCFDANGDFDTELLFQYHRHQLRQDTLCKKVSSSLVNAALSAAESEENVEYERPLKIRKHRSCHRHQINIQRLDDGRIVPIEPTGSSWYIQYVLYPNVNDSKFVERFRRRFRCNYASFTIILQLVQENPMFKRWQGTDAAGRSASPIELLLLGSLRYLGRGWSFDDLEEATSISQETHRCFFHIFINFSRHILYPMYVIHPTDGTDVLPHVHEMEIAGLHGCIGSVDATHVGMLRCPFIRRNEHLGPKENMPARTYNIVVNHRRMILSSTAGHPSRWNDQTVTMFDKFLQGIKHNKILSDYRFNLLHKDNTGSIVERKFSGCWLLCDNGYPRWSMLIPPMKEPITYDDARFSEWVESMRKDVECTFGILKG
jgi:Plant transposon protein